MWILRYLKGEYCFESFDDVKKYINKSNGRFILKFNKDKKAQVFEKTKLGKLECVLMGRDDDFTDYPVKLYDTNNQLLYSHNSKKRVD